MKDLKKISEYLLRIGDETEMKTFLGGILTDAEKSSIAGRIKIVEMLKSGYAQRDIAERLGVGIATVTRGSVEVKAGKFDTKVWRDFKSWRS